MKHSNSATEHISGSFERFNPYAQQALQRIDEDESQTYATLALAFELSQLRYQMSKRSVDSDIRERVQSRA